MEVETEGVRVLTVHASKGLEAPIVFLPDACGAPDARNDPKLMRLSPPEAGRPAGPRLGQEVKRGRRRGRGRALGGARGRGRRASAPALCRDDPRGSAPHRRGLRNHQEPPARLLVRSRPFGACRVAPQGAGAIPRRRTQFSVMAMAFGPRMAARRLRRVRARPCPAGSSRGGARVRRPSAQPFAHRRRRRGRPRADHRGPARARAAADAAQSRAERREGAAKAYLDLRGGALAEAARAALAAKVLAAIGAPELAAPLWSRLPRRSRAGGPPAAARTSGPALTAAVLTGSS